FGSSFAAGSVNIVWRDIKLTALESGKKGVNTKRGPAETSESASCRLSAPAVSVPSGEKGDISLILISGPAVLTHSLQYFYTASTGIERFPRFVAVGVVDGEQIDYYDSVSEKNVLKQTWMEGVRDESSITNIRRGTQQNFQGNIGIAMERFNQTTGKIFSPNGDLFTHTFIFIYIFFFLNMSHFILTSSQFTVKI
uniref:MHC class I-like antigen recognition-like domain-containing protein n=1 Tax=Pundamilia nyererei TaxID=303518 RepID=A0A3B4H681_9CICH